MQLQKLRSFRVSSMPDDYDHVFNNSRRFHMYMAVSGPQANLYALGTNDFFSVIQIKNFHEDTIVEIPNNNGPINSLALSPDGEFLAVSGDYFNDIIYKKPSYIFIYNIKTKEVIKEIIGNKQVCRIALDKECLIVEYVNKLGKDIIIYSLFSN
jgi:hypothetical protein